MGTRPGVIALLVASSFAEAVAGEAPGELLTDATYAAVRDHVLPTRDELAWQQIGWRPTFWAAVIEAQRDEKPILLWAMNGHPCGET